LTRVLIVGSGPAGASLAYLLARRGIDVTLLERQEGFGREFRGELLMPSGVEALEQMGLSKSFSVVPTELQKSLTLYMNGELVFNQELTGQKFEEHPPQAVCQTKFLEMLVSEAAKSPSFRIKQGASVKALLYEAGRVVGVRVRTKTGEEHLRSDLVIGADGRASIVRKQGDFRAHHVSPPLDIVWLKLPCPQDWTGARLYMGSGHFLLGYRTWDGHLQLAWIIIKGTFGDLKDQGIEHWFQQMEAHVSPDLASHLRVQEGAIEKPFVLDAVSDCVENWSVPGALLIGDAAHTMSPVGGQGINIALRDAIVAANHMVPAILDADPSRLTAALLSIERERMPEVKKIQRLQGLPPRVGFSQAWWGEPVRTVVSRLARYSRVRLAAAGRLSEFPFGVTKVDLRV
jgi:2-polyprenyl-6-methoxyphenol hydroxylase-like FAD-dependent oxidoreductase